MYWQFFQIAQNLANTYVDKSTTSTFWLTM